MKVGRAPSPAADALVGIEASVRGDSRASWFVVLRTAMPTHTAGRSLVLRLSITMIITTYVKGSVGVTPRVSVSPYKYAQPPLFGASNYSAGSIRREFGFAQPSTEAIQLDFELSVASRPHNVPGRIAGAAETLHLTG